MFGLSGEAAQTEHQSFFYSKRIFRKYHFDPQIHMDVPIGLKSEITDSNRMGRKNRIFHYDQNTTTVEIKVVSQSAPGADDHPRGRAGSLCHLG